MKALLIGFLVKIFFTLKTFLPLNLAATFPPLFADPARIESRRLRVNLTSAQILALETGSIALVPAPGVGFVIVPRQVTMVFFGGSVAYLDGGGGAVTFAVGSLSVALASNAIFLVTTSPNRRVQTLDWSAAAVGTGVTGTAGNPPTEDNAALTIAKATANFTAGNGTMQITVDYDILPTT